MDGGDGGDGGGALEVKGVETETLALTSDTTSSGNGNGNVHRKGHGSSHSCTSLSLSNGHGSCWVKSFTYESLAAATGGFGTRLGTGGSGSVFKGVLPSGTQIAVKRLQDPAGVADCNRSVADCNRSDCGGVGA